MRSHSTIPRTNERLNEWTKDERTKGWTTSQRRNKRRTNEGTNNEQKSNFSVNVGKCRFFSFFDAFNALHLSSEQRFFLLWSVGVGVGNGVGVGVGRTNETIGSTNDQTAPKNPSNKLLRPKHLPLKNYKIFGLKICVFVIFERAKTNSKTGIAKKQENTKKLAKNMFWKHENCKLYAKCQ